MVDAGIVAFARSEEGGQLWEPFLADTLQIIGRQRIGQLL
jgi:hypothetical protein